MADEIERRFLVDPKFVPASIAHGFIDIKQSYVKTLDPDAIIRVRESTRDGITTHKLEVKHAKTAMTNDEEPADITPAMYTALRRHCSIEVIKRRHLINHAGHMWEVDVYQQGDPNLPMIAEVELPSENTPLPIPTWATTEVTGLREYSNARIAHRMEHRTEYRPEHR